MDLKAIKLLKEKNLVFLATTMKDGSPQVSPVWANFEDDHIMNKHSRRKNQTH